MKVVLASRNPGKIAEYRELFASMVHSVVGLDEAGVASAFEPPEVASTFEGNALIKALLYGQHCGQAVLAEDSGLCIDALDGRPGVKSARYVSGSDQARICRVLEEMQDVPDELRTAHFCAVAVWFDPVNERIEITEGIWRGRIAYEPRGVFGFGYDPIFIDAVSGKTGGELSTEEKNTCSHRALALRAIVERLSQRIDR